MHPASTIAKDRIITVDALRGVALLGIMIVHFLYWYTAGPLPEQVYTKYNDAGSTVARIFSELFLAGKFFAFFSFLFGLSFYLQTGEKGKSPRGVVARFAWRITLLFFIGLIHHAFWQGDILSIYAPLGFVLLLSRKMNDRWVLLAALLLVLNIPGKIFQLVQLFSVPEAQGFAGFGDGAASYDKLIAGGGWQQIFAYNLLHLPAKFQFQVESGRLLITLGFFLLGMYVGRQKWFEQGAIAKRNWRRICKRSAAIAGGCLLIGLCLFGANEMWKLGLEQKPLVGFCFSILFDGFNACLVAFYVSGLSLLMFRRRWQRFLYPLAPVGKMALTSYLTQTLVGLLLFWGVGAGLYAKTSNGTNFVIAIGFFYGQVVISKRWLSHFYFGPVEWLWRSATLLKRQRMVRETNLPLLPAEGLVNAVPDAERLEKTGA